MRTPSYCTAESLPINMHSWVATNDKLRAGRTVVDSIVWMPYGDLMFEDPERLRYLDRILGFAKIRLIDTIERFRVHKGGALPPHLEHVRPMPCRPCASTLRGPPKPERHGHILATEAG